MLRRCLAFASLILLPAAAQAEPMKLGGPEIKETFTGSHIELDTPLGTTIPIRFTGDGLMTGQAGSLASVLGAAQDRGRWWVKGNRLCYKWFRWFEAQEQCMTIRVRDERVFWLQDDGKRGTATIVGRPPVVTAALEPPAVKIPVRSVPVEAPATESAQAPVLKSAPRLAVRPKSAAEELGVAEDAPADRGLFFVGLGLSRALRSQLKITSAEAADLKAAGLVEEKAPPKAAPASITTKASAAAGTAKPIARTSFARASSAVEPASTTGPAKPAAAVRSAVGADGSDLAAPPVPAVAPAAPSFSVYGVAAGDVLNMRSGPSEDYAIVGRIPPNGNGVRMVGPCITFWCQIQFRNTRGWVNRYYLAQN